MEKLPPMETRDADLTGIISVSLKDNEDFNLLGSRLAGYNPERFKAIALRVFIENTPVVTVYALEKSKADEPKYQGKLPVHKFKKEMSFDELFYQLKNVNFTVTTGEYDLEEMEVLNR